MVAAVAASARAASSLPSRSSCSTRGSKVASFCRLSIPDEPLPARDPGVRVSDLPSKQESERQPERTAGGAWMVTPFDMSAMQAIKHSPKLVLPTAQVRRRGETLEIVNVQGTRLIGLDERYVGSVPRATIEILARAMLADQTCGPLASLSDPTLGK